MENLIVYEESLGDVGYSKGLKDTYASWTDDDVSYISRGVVVDGLLEVYVIEDGVEEELLIDVPYMDEVIEAIENFNNEQEFKFLASISYGAYRKNEKCYHLSKDDLIFSIEGRCVRYEPTKVGGLYNVYEERNGKEVFTGPQLLTGSEYFKFIKNDIKKEEAI